MANQIKRKYIAPDAIDGTRLLLESGDAVRGKDAQGNVVDIYKFEGGVAKANGASLAYQSALDAEISARQAADLTFLKLDGTRGMKADLSFEEAGAGGGGAATYAQGTPDQNAVPMMDRYAFSFASPINAPFDVYDTAGVKLGTVSFDMMMFLFQWTPAPGSVVMSANIMGVLPLNAVMSGQGITSLNIDIQKAYAVVGMKIQTSAGGGGGGSTYHKIVGLADGVSARDAVNKGQMDTAISSAVQGELQRAQSAEQALGVRIDNILSNTDSTALNSLAELVSAYEAADQNLQGSLTQLAQTATSNLNTEIQNRQNADTALDNKINQEIIDRQLGDAGLNSRLVPFEKRAQVLKFPIYENAAPVYADGQPGVQDPTVIARDGWYYTNAVLGQKINWYFYDGNSVPSNVTLGEVSAYAVVTLDSLASLPILAIYTKATGSGDIMPGFAHSKKVYSLSSAGLMTGVKYVIYTGENPAVFPELPHVQMSLSANSAGDQADSEVVYTAAFNSNSAAAIGNVKFVVEALGVWAPTWKQEAMLRIKGATQSGLNAEISARQAADSALDARIAAIEADSSTQTYIDEQVGLLDGRLDILEGASTVTGSVDQKVKSAIDSLVGGASSLYDTLKEVEDYITADGAAAAQMTAQLGNHEGRLDTLEGDSTVVGSIDYKVASEAAAREAAVSGLDARLDVIEGMVWTKEKFVVDAQMIADGYVTLAHAPKVGTTRVVVGRLALHEGTGEDYTVAGAQVNFLNSIAVGGDEALVVGDQIFVQYLK